jgi:hypothetical protein
MTPRYNWIYIDSRNSITQCDRQQYDIWFLINVFEKEMDAKSVSSSVILSQMSLCVAEPEVRTEE